MNSNPSLFFVAVLPPPDIQDYATQIKQHFAQNYASRAALRSPPHITLQAPFKWLGADAPLLEECLRNFASCRKPVPVILDGFAAFPPRVIYINVLRTPELLELQADLMTCMETKLEIVDPVSKTRPFAPHMTLAFKDLTKQNFKAAWPEFQQRHLHFEFIATQLTLLIHDGRRWNVKSEFLLQGESLV